MPSSWSQPMRAWKLQVPFCSCQAPLDVNKARQAVEFARPVAQTTAVMVHLVLLRALAPRMGDAGTGLGEHTPPVVARQGHQPLFR